MHHFDHPLRIKIVEEVSESGSPEREPTSRASHRSPAGRVESEEDRNRLEQSGAMGNVIEF